MEPKKWKQPKNINNIVGRLLNKWKTTSSQKAIIMDKLWAKIAGEQVAAHTKVMHISQGKMVVFAENAAWMNELTFMKKTIKIRAKSILLEHNIKIDDVVFRLGKGK